MGTAIFALSRPFIVKVAHASFSFAHARFPGVSPRVDGDWNLRTFEASL